MENNSQILIYSDESGRTKLDVRLEDETVWLTQKLMAELFQTTIPNINIHLKNIFEEGELQQNSVIKDFLTTAADGKNYQTKFYNLDAIISVGYRIKSSVATQFRIWATQRLREYIVKGFALNDERFKSGNSMNYFNELQQRIRRNNGTAANADVYERLDLAARFNSPAQWTRTAPPRGKNQPRKSSGKIR